MKEKRTQQRILILGAGGHCRVTIDLLLHHEHYEIVGILDDNPKLDGTRVFGFDIMGPISRLMEISYRNCKVAVGIAKPEIRRKVFEEAVSLGYAAIGLVSPSAYIAHHVRIGRGSMIMANAAIGIGTRIGRGAIINTGAIVEHECNVGDFVHIAPGAHLAGSVEVGLGAFVGLGASIKEFVAVGEKAMIGAGAVVVNDVPAGSIVFGNPARVDQEVRR